MFHVARVYARVRNIRRRKMVAGTVGGEEDRMTMKTSDLPVCLLYLLLCCCGVYPNAHRNLTHIVRDFVPTTGLCAPRESDWAAGRRTVDDLRPRATNLNDISQNFSDGHTTI